MITSRIRFEADEGNVNEVLSRIQRQARETLADVAGESAQSGAVGSGSVRDVRSRISDLDEMSRIEYQAKRIEFADRIRSINRDADLTPEQREIQINKLKAEETLYRETLEQDKLQSMLLKNILDAIQSTAREQIESDEADVRGRVRDYEAGKLDLTEEERLIIEEQRGILSEKDAYTAMPKDKGVLQWLQVAKGMVAASMIDKMLQMPNLIATSEYGEEVIAGMWDMVPIVGGAFSKASERSLKLQEERDDAMLGLYRMGIVPRLYDTGLIDSEITTSKGNMKTLQDEYNALEKRNKTELDEIYAKYSYNDPQTGYMMFWGDTEDERKKNRVNFEKEIDAFSSKQILQNEKKKELDASKLELERLQDKIETGYDAWLKGGISDLGYDQIEYTKMTADISRAQGFVKDSTSAFALGKEYARITRGFDVSEGDIQNIAKVLRTDRTTTLSQATMLIDDAMRWSGMSGVRQGEAFGITTGLMQSWQGRGISGDFERASNIMASFQKLGGTFYDSASMMAIDTKLASTGDDFEEMMAYQVYAQQMAKDGKPVTYLGFLKWKEEGLRGEGSLKGRLDLIKSSIGTGDLGVLMTKKISGVRSIEEAELMLTDYEESEIGKRDREEAEAKIKSKAKVTSKQVSKAEISDAFLDNMAKGMEMVMKDIGKSMADKIASMDLPIGLDDILAKWITKTFDVEQKGVK